MTTRRAIASFTTGLVLAGAFGCASAPPRVTECDMMFERAKELTAQGMPPSDFARLTADLRAKLARDPETARLTCVFVLDALSAPSASAPNATGDRPEPPPRLAEPPPE